MPRPIQATLHLPALAHNLALLKQHCPLSRCMPVAKADAYGHRLEQVLPALQQADALAILELSNAINLRQWGWSKPVVLLEGCFDAADQQLALQHRLDWVVHSQAQLQTVLNLGEQDLLAHRPQIFLKLNTGMNRLGLTLDQAPQAIADLDAWALHHRCPTPVLMTHFANADLPAQALQGVSPLLQHQRLMTLKPSHWPSSLGNSAGVLNWPALSGDVVRPGIAVYGTSPGPQTALQYGLQAAHTLSTQIIAVQHVQAGERVGYGSRWVAQQNSTIAVLACGYADGYPRHAPDGTPVWVDGVRAPLAGRVSMDMMTIDITQVPSAQVGTTVELWGQHLPVDEVAEHCGTISYELLCAVTTRVPYVVQPLPTGAF